MEIKVAKTAGFCFGVNRAVELTYGLLAEGRRVATLGPLIHNPQAVADMQAKGAFVADSVHQVPDGYEVVIRSHGVPRSVYDELEARGIAYHDATCPFVQKIQRIAAQAEKEGAVLLVAGDKTHPEVQGIVGHTRGEVFVFADLEELAAWKGPSDPQKPLFAVAQTTFQVTKWKESSEFLKKAKNKSQYDSTLNLPKTLFEMRAGLPKKEPAMLEDWEKNDLYNNLIKHNDGSFMLMPVLSLEAQAHRLWLAPRPLSMTKQWS